MLPVLVLLAARAVSAAEPVTFKTTVKEVSGSQRNGTVSITIIPAKDIHVNAGRPELTFRISAPKNVKFDRTRYTEKKEFTKPRTFVFRYRLLDDLKSPAKVKIDVSYVYCSGEKGSCMFASKSLTVRIPSSSK